MLDRIRRPRLVRAALLTVACVTVGYVSNALSAGSCERATDRWLYARLSEVPTNRPGRHAYSEPARYALPWLVAVDYEYAVGSTGGEWGTRYYVGLFGFPLPARHHIRVQS